MRKFAVALAMVAGLVGCQCKSHSPAVAAPIPLAAKDALSSAVSADADDDDEIAVELQDSPAFDEELRQLQAAEPEKFMFNSAEGAHDGVVLGVLAANETMDQALERLRRDPRVKVAEPVVSVHADYVPNDPQYTMQWNLKQIHMEKAWDVAQGEGVIVAVIDTGIAYEDYGEFKQVPDLKGAKFAPGYDFVNDTEHPNDDNGHGTHVAGTIAQVTDNGEGVAGVAFKATLMPIKVLDADGFGQSPDIADAIHWAADHGAQVINMSLGGGAPSKLMGDAVAYARKKGVVVVCAAGNGSRAIVEYPAAYPGAVAVSAVRFDGQLAPYSSYGKEVDIAAPGGDKSVDQNGDGQPDGILQNTIDPADPSKSIYAWFQGTSMATPHVAGAAAVLISAGAKTPDEVENALFAGAQSRGSAWNNRTGFGILDVEASLKALKAGTHPKAAFAPASEPVATEAPCAWSSSASAMEAERESATAGVTRTGLGILLALGVAATLRKRQRNPLGPALLAALTLSAAGLFFLPKPGVTSMGTMGWIASIFRFLIDLLEIPMPDWGKWLFGPGRASPFFYSAAIPLVLSFIGYNWKASRQVMGGICFGFASFMIYAAWSQAPGLAWMPFHFLALPWLVINALVCLFLGRALVRKVEV